MSNQIKSQKSVQSVLRVSANQTFSRLFLFLESLVTRFKYAWSKRNNETRHDYHFREPRTYLTQRKLRVWQVPLTTVWSMQLGNTNRDISIWPEHSTTGEERQLVAVGKVGPAFRQPLKTSVAISRRNTSTKGSRRSTKSPTDIVTTLPTLKASAENGPRRLKK